MTRTASTAAVPDTDGARISRRIEMWIAGIGLGSATVLQGGFAVAVTRSDGEALEAAILPALRSAGFALSHTTAYAAVHTLAAWFGLSLIAMALLCAAGFFAASRRPRRRSTGWWFFAAGLACLFGTQLLLYPVAFLFFLTAGLFAVRTLHVGSQI
ncbi:hypothetical protein [Microbacterium sp. Marseille-Q6648]|uniref:hypothetical protein n=1 Tax=Microbacterium sp. Marseille-Q6648 TaxID=2937991 RepID=UPI00204128F4|nr:hypothetical protein [Microbacterium sp. Marseille-Q6648]